MGHTWETRRCDAAQVSGFVAFAVRHFVSYTCVADCSESGCRLTQTRRPNYIYEGHVPVQGYTFYVTRFRASACVCSSIFSTGVVVVVFLLTFTPFWLYIYKFLTGKCMLLHFIIVLGRFSYCGLHAVGIQTTPGGLPKASPSVSDGHPLRCCNVLTPTASPAPSPSPPFPPPHQPCQREPSFHVCTHPIFHWVTTKLANLARVQTCLLSPSLSP